MTTDNWKSHLHATFGASAGLVVSLMFQPLEILKLSYILHWEKTRSFGKLVEFIIKNDGIKGFWKGLIPTAARSASGSGVFFFTLRFLQSLEISKSRSTLVDGMNSTISRSFNAIILNPLTILQIRSQIPGYKPYKNMLVGLYSILTDLKLSSFSKGIVPVLWKEAIFGGFFYALYQRLQIYLPGGKFVAGILSGMIATTVSHPFELIRAKMQAGGEFENQLNAKSGMFKNLKQIFRNEGVSGLMRGVGMRLIKKPLINTATFIMYETMQNKMIKENKKQ